MIVTIDLETYYSTEYSLSKMSEVDYILDPRFQLICCSFKIDNNPTVCVWGEVAIRDYVARIDWSRVAMLAHNNRFDGAILAWILGVVPGAYLDTLSMARALTHSVIGRSSLAKVSDYLGLPPKGTEVVRAMGKRIDNFTSDEAREYMDYCIRDADNCKSIFDIFMAVFPKDELVIVDWNLRMFIKPQVQLNPDKLALHLSTVQAEKASALARVAHIDKSVFSSNKKFAELLWSMGVDVPMKLSPTTGDMIPAIAKNDVQFKELCSDSSLPPEVQAVLNTRASVKSTIEETRTSAMLNLSLREWQSTAIYPQLVCDTPNGRSMMPVPLKYSAAHTHRFGGDGGFNFQNLQRKSAIRDAIEAPRGWRILHRDASQIEARMVAALARCVRLLAGFEANEDIYSVFATSIYGYLVTKAQKGERFIGKTSILGLGYGMGAPRFKRTLYLGQGGQSADITEEEALRIVNLYRRTYQEIPDLWTVCGNLLETMMELSHPWGSFGKPPRRTMQVGVIPAIEWSGDALWLPNGLCIAYPNLHRAPPRQLPDGRMSTGEIAYTGPNGESKHLFGGKVLENLSQALSRVVITETVVRVKKETKHLPFMTTHDSLDYLVPERDVEAWDAYLDRQFSIRPTWMPTLPLASEGGWGRTLMEAEMGLNQ